MPNPPDALITYRFRPPAEGGRLTLPGLDYRADWRYADDAGNCVWMVHKRFLGADGRPLQGDGPAPAEGLAELRFVDRELASTVHRGRLRPGVLGYLVEGGAVTADARVVEVSPDLC